MLVPGLDGILSGQDEQVKKLTDIYWSKEILSLVN